MPLVLVYHVELNQSMNRTVKVISKTLINKMKLVVPLIDCRIIHDLVLVDLEILLCFRQFCCVDTLLFQGQVASPLVEPNTQVLLVAFEDVLERLLNQDSLGGAVIKATRMRIILFIVDPDTIDYEIKATTTTQTHLPTVVR